MMKHQSFTIQQRLLLVACLGAAYGASGAIARYALVNHAAHLGTIEVGLGLFCVIFAMRLKICKPTLKAYILSIIPLALAIATLSSLFAQSTQ